MEDVGAAEKIIHEKLNNHKEKMEHQNGDESPIQRENSPIYPVSFSFYFL